MKFIIGILLLFQSHFLSAQYLYSASDSILIFKKLDLADEQDFRGEIDSAYSTVQWIIHKARNIKMMRGLAYAQLKKADLLLKKSEYTEIENLLGEGFKMGYSLNDSLIMGLAHTQKAQLKRTLGEFESSIESLQKAIECYSPRDHLLYIGVTYNELAHNFAKLSDYEKSIDYGYQALKIFEKLENDKERANTMNNIAVNFYKLNDKKTAIDIFKQVLQIQEEIGDLKRVVSTLGNLVVAYTNISLDSAILYQEKSLDLVEKLGIKSAQANSYSQTASLYDRKSDPIKSLAYFQKALKLYYEMEEPGKLASVNINCASQSALLNDSTGAETYFKSALKYAIESKDKTNLQNLHQAQSKFYQQFGNFPLALTHFKESILYKDSIFNEKSNAKIAELSIKYDTEKKELQLANSLQEQKRKEAELDIKNKELRIIRLIQNKNEQSLQLIEKEKEIQSIKIGELSSENIRKDLINKTQIQNVRLLEKDNLIKQKQIDQKNQLILASLIAIAALAFIAYLIFNRYKLKKQIEERISQDKIRDKIARDLHDEIGSSLTSIHLLSLSTENQLQLDPVKPNLSLREIQLQSKKIQQNMSDIVWALGSEHDKLESLSARIKEFAFKILNSKNIQVHFNQDPDILDVILGIETRKEILLICKEMITNVVKHSDATEVIIEIKKMNSGLKIAVTDNGTDLNDQFSTGTGLKSMMLRAEKIGGTFRLYRNNDRTIAEVLIP